MGLLVARNRKSTDDKGAPHNFLVLAFGTPQEVLWKENFRSSTRGIGGTPGQRTSIIAATRDRRTSCIGQPYRCHRPGYPYRYHRWARRASGSRVPRYAGGAPAGEFLVAAPIDIIHQGFQCGISELQDCNSASQRRRAKAYGDRHEDWSPGRSRIGSSVLMVRLAASFQRHRARSMPPFAWSDGNNTPKAPMAISLSAISHVGGHR